MASLRRLWTYALAPVADCPATTRLLTHPNHPSHPRRSVVAPEPAVLSQASRSSKTWQNRCLQNLSTCVSPCVRPCTHAQRPALLSTDAFHMPAASPRAVAPSARPAVLSEPCCCLVTMLTQPSQPGAVAQLALGLMRPRAVDKTKRTGNRPRMQHEPKYNTESGNRSSKCAHVFVKGCPKAARMHM